MMVFETSVLWKRYQSSRRSRKQNTQDQKNWHLQRDWGQLTIFCLRKEDYLPSGFNIRVRIQANNNEPNKLVIFHGLT